MSYMLLVLQSPGDVAQGSEGKRRYDRMMAYARDIADRGLLVAAAGAEARDRNHGGEDDKGPVQVHGEPLGASVT